MQTTDVGLEKDHPSKGPVKHTVMPRVWYRPFPTSTHCDNRQGLLDKQAITTDHHYQRVPCVHVQLQSGFGQVCSSNTRMYINLHRCCGTQEQPSDGKTGSCFPRWVSIYCLLRLLPAFHPQRWGAAQITGPVATHAATTHIIVRRKQKRWPWIIYNEQT